jgi:hypothetical protein
MQKQQNQYKNVIPGLLVTLVLACLGLAPAAHGAGHQSIVGMWSVHYVSNQGFPDASAFIQWHSDGLEFESANLAPGVLCQGTYKQARNGSYHDYHIAWTFDSTGTVNGYWDEIMITTVSGDGKSYSGTYTRDFFDLNGNLLFEDDGTMIATRLTPRS